MEKSIWIDLSKYSGTEFEALSKMVQEHAFKLGAEWASGDKKIYNYYIPFFNIRFDNTRKVNYMRCGYLADEKPCSVKQFLLMNKFPWEKKNTIFIYDSNKSAKKIIDKNYKWLSPGIFSSIPYFSPGIIYVDFSWVKGEARKILITRSISIMHSKGYSGMTDISLENCSYFCINKKTKIFFTCKHTPKNATEVKCNAILEGKLQ